MGPRLALISLFAVAAVAPDGAAPRLATRGLAHDTYIWQRSWTGAVQESVAAAPAELGGLRVLMLEVMEPATTVPGARLIELWSGVEPAALVRAARPVTAVVRIEGARVPVGVPMATVLAKVAAWRAAGVDVIGVEIDHDSATSELGAYAAWLARARPASLRWSITALPTWADDRAGLAQVAAAVDELVVQVHAVRAPHIFDDGEARAWIRRVAAAVPHAALRVAVPTYRVALGAADPFAVARFVRWLESDDAPPVRGVVWFRLPVDGDRDAWPAATLTAVIRGERLAPAVTTRLIERASGLHDLVITNTGTLTAPWPALRLRGDVEAADLIGGYVASTTPGSWTPPPRELLPGTTTVVGWATGKAIAIDAR